LDALDAQVSKWQVRKSAEIMVDCISNVLSTHQGNELKKTCISKVLLSPIIAIMICIYFESIQVSWLIVAQEEVIKRLMKTMKLVIKHALLTAIVSFGGNFSMISKTHILGVRLHNVALAVEQRRVMEQSGEFS
jgi:hypothetical protein